MTPSPSPFSTSWDSPVSIAWLTLVRPATTSPSVGIFSPGLTSTRSPGRRASSGTSSMEPSARRRCASAGRSRTSWSRAREAPSTERISIQCPSSMMSMSVAVSQKNTLIDIMLLGHWIEMRSVLGASRALEELVRLLPAEAHRLRSDGSTLDVPVTDLRQGDLVLVRPGERIPSDGAITEGRTTVNQALLTGESQPVEKGPGDAVLGGSVNGEAAITLRITRTGAETYLAQGIEVVRRAQQTRSRTQDLANRAAMWLTVIAIAAGVTTLIAWLAGGRSFDFALERMVTVMVITCPHALGLAVPLVVAVSTALSPRNGLLIRDRAAFERARALHAV